MELGGPVWHASAAGEVGRAELRRRALDALSAVGDKRLGEWHQWTGVAYHVRRRLSAQEQMLVGPVVDIRGTEEADQRWRAASASRPDIKFPRDY